MNRFADRWWLPFGVVLGLLWGADANWRATVEVFGLHVHKGERQ
jgi:hypothetical protein